MRIGILTFHYMLNEGGIWQAYSLTKYLREKFPNSKVEIIDFRPKERYNYVLENYDNEKHNRYFSFLSPYLTKSCFISNDSEEIFGYISKNYDICISGSDTVWFFHQERNLLSRLIATREKNFLRIPKESTYLNKFRIVINHYKMLWKDFNSTSQLDLSVPNAYWLPWENSPFKKVSFAASVGYLDFEFFSKDQKKLLRNLLNDFDLLGVRDKNTENVLKYLGVESFEYVPDPTWMFDEKLPDIKIKLKNIGIKLEKKKVGILCPDNSRTGYFLNRFLPKLFHSLGFQTISIIDQNKNVEFDLATQVLDIFEWWSVIRELDFFFTVRTHPNIAALKYHTPFINIDVTAIKNSSKRSKSYELLQEFGLEKYCIFQRSAISKKKIEKIVLEAIHDSWNWKKISLTASRLEEKCKKFIDQIEEKL